MKIVYSGNRLCLLSYLTGMADIFKAVYCSYKRAHTLLTKTHTVPLLLQYCAVTLSIYNKLGYDFHQFSTGGTMD